MEKGNGLINTGLYDNKILILGNLAQSVHELDINHTFYLLMLVKIVVVWYEGGGGLV